MENMTLMSLLKISYVIPVLLLCSVVMVAYMFERFWAFMRIGRMDSNTAERIKQSVRQGQVKEAIAICGRKPSFIDCCKPREYGGSNRFLCRYYDGLCSADDFPARCGRGRKTRSWNRWSIGYYL